MNMKNKNIINCQVLAIKEDHIVVDHNGDTYTCLKSQISDYNVNLDKFFKIGYTYKFLLQLDNELSYKKLRPKLVKNKKKPMPTMSHYVNLEKKLLSEIKE